jgi:hypothetical protein
VSISAYVILGTTSGVKGGATVELAAFRFLSNHFHAAIGRCNILLIATLKSLFSEKITVYSALFLLHTKILGSHGHAEIM